MREMTEIQQRSARNAGVWAALRDRENEIQSVERLQQKRESIAFIHKEKN